MMRSRTLAAAAIASAVLIGAPVLATPAQAQQASYTSASTVVPVVLWAATGAVIGAVAWPLVVGGAAAGAAPGVMSLAAFLNTGAAAGAVLGSAGYIMTR
jgi:hypothetical protein